MDARQHPDADVSGLLEAWRQGDVEARDRLMAVVYQELRRRAAAHLRRERVGHTLQPTALVHEAYLRLVRQDLMVWQNRAQFFGIASQMMRRILVDRARARNMNKRSGRWARVTLAEEAGQQQAREVEVLDFDHALVELATFDPRKSQIAELRFFGGLSLEEAGHVVGVSVATVEREWQAARAWLYARLTGKTGGLGSTDPSCSLLRRRQSGPYRVDSTSHPLCFSPRCLKVSNMTQERWHQITGIFHAARACDPARRDAFVAEQCLGDPALQHEVEAMLAGLDDAGEFGERAVFLSASALEPGPPLGVTQLAARDRLGPYEIIAALGAGGMGEVYRAHDSRLSRDVAIKTLPPAFSNNPDRLTRFRQEARMLASLNHPNIAAIYGLERSGDVDHLVLELVEGDDPQRSTTGREGARLCTVRLPRHWRRRTAKASSTAISSQPTSRSRPTAA